ncbi:tetratricopeptide repeat protein [Avibacterium avium]|uniref:tetratricopeptide repeat protein n=1 Tax=Avibacterium avium TaxID=751 RepID=UPI003BF85640
MKLKKLFLTAFVSALAFNASFANAKSAYFEQELAKAKAGNYLAQFNVGTVYLAENNKDALKWITQSAEQNFAGAQFVLGDIYSAGELVKQNDAEALVWYRKAADKGFPLAQLRLGILYWQGKTVNKDTQKAVSWFEKAAYQGEPEAQFYLAKAYYSGEGVKQDKTQATEWVKKACGRTPLASCDYYQRLTK